MPFTSSTPFLRKKPVNRIFIDLRRQRRGGGVDHRRIAAETNCQRHLTLCFFLLLKVASADFVEVPMHAGGARIENLQAIEPDVSRAFDGIFGKDHRQRNKWPCIAWPAGEHRKNIQIRFAKDHFLTGAVFDDLGRDAGKLYQI